MTARAVGWPFDPKGVVGEPEYEIGASLRNPYQKPELFAVAGTVERRLLVFETELGLNLSRTLSWSWAQAVLATIWLVEDERSFEAGHHFLALARTIRQMLGLQDDA